MYLYRFLLAEGHVSRLTVVPRVDPFVDELLLLSFIPNGSVGLVDADDINVVLQRSTLLAKDQIVCLIENTPSLLFVGCFLCIDSQCLQTDYREK